MSLQQVPLEKPLAVSGGYISEIELSGFSASRWPRRARNAHLPAASQIVLDASSVQAGMPGEDKPKPADCYAKDGTVAILTIEGPLYQRAASTFCFDFEGYDTILQKLETAFNDPTVQAILMRVDSPGGDVAGCFETVRAIRAMKARSGKPLVAYVDECACSAMYALASCADKIITPSTGMLGSIGVIAMFREMSAAMATSGIKVNIITSGSAKADGNPYEPMQEETRARLQAEIDQLAQIFAMEMQTNRGIPAADILGLQAQTFIGANAVQQRLADMVGGYEDALATARSMIRPTASGARAAGRTQGRKTMETVLKTLGLPEGASEAEAVARISSVIQGKAEAEARATAASTAATTAVAAAETRAVAAESQVAKLVELSGAESADQLEGLVAAWRKRDEETVAAQKAEHARLLEEGKAQGKISAEFAPHASALPLDGLKAFLGSTKPVLPMNEKLTPAATANVGKLTHNGKTYAQMSTAEKHALHREDPGLFAQMKSASSR